MMEHNWIAAIFLLFTVLSDVLANPVEGGGGSWNYNFQSSNRFRQSPGFPGFNRFGQSSGSSVFNTGSNQSPGFPVFNTGSGQSPGSPVLNTGSGQQEGSGSNFITRFNPSQRLSSFVNNVYGKTDRYDLASSVLRAMIEHAVGAFVPG